MQRFGRAEPSRLETLGQCFAGNPSHGEKRAMLGGRPVVHVTYDGRMSDFGERMARATGAIGRAARCPARRATS